MSKNIFKRIKDEQHSAGYIIYDIVAILAAAALSLVIRFDFSFVDVEPDFWETLMRTMIANVIVSLIIFVIARLYSILWRYAGLKEIIRLFFAVILADVAYFIIVHIVSRHLPRSFYVFYPILLMIFMTLARLHRQFFGDIAQIFRKPREEATGTITLLYGAGKAGQRIMQEINGSDFVTRRVPCVLDDDEKKWGTYMMGVPVVGGRDKLEECVEQYQIEEIIVAIPTLDNKERKELLQVCSQTGCKISMLPGIYQLINQEVSISALRPVELEDLLGRDPVDSHLESIMGYVRDKVVLVTGGGGSIGSELCRQIAQYEPKQLIILDNYENNAYDLQMELQKHYPQLNLAVVIASVQNRERIHDIFQTYRPHLVCHAAAHKHVPLMEDSPCEAIKNNVFGTVNVTLEAEAAGVQRFVMISTDKAVRPTNIMGASKRICEMIVQIADRESQTEFVSVRFGNVLGSNGSVVPLFKKQIAEGGPVTVTHPDIIRYFMTVPEAVSLVLQAGAYAKGGEIFILDMGEPVKILDMAKNLIRLSGYEPGVDIEIQFTGLRPGEKLYEELLMDEEKTETENHRIFIGQQIPIEADYLREKLEGLREAAYGEDKNIRRLVKELVPEYTIQAGD